MQIWNAARRKARWLVPFFLLCFITSAVHAADEAAGPHSIPSVDAGIGSCSVVLTVRDESSAPVYAAKVRVHIAYGFAGAHKMDLEAGTNVDGKARFDGLPDRVKQALHFEASKDDREGSAFYNPSENCKAEHEIVIRKTPPQQ